MKNVTDIVMTKIDNELSILSDQIDDTDYKKYLKEAERYDGGIFNYKDGHGETFHVGLMSEFL